jgi:hypothetical protein
VVWPLQSTNQPRRALSVGNINADIRLKPDDLAQLLALHAEWRGVILDLSGTLTNASFVRTWRFARRPGQPAVPIEERLYRLLAEAAKLRLPTGAGLSGRFAGDARDVRGFAGELILSVPALFSPWADGRNWSAELRAVPASTANGEGRIDVTFAADQATTPWGRAARLRLTCQTEPWAQSAMPDKARLMVEADEMQTRWCAAQALAVNATLDFHANNAALRQTELIVVANSLDTPWGQAGASRVEARLTHAPTNLLGASADLAARVSGVRTGWGSAQHAQAMATTTLPATNALALFNTNLTWLARAQLLPLQATLAVTNLDTPKLQAQEALVDARWQWPTLAVECGSSLSGGVLAAKAGLDAETRDVTFAGQSSCDPHGLAGVLSTNTQRWLTKYSWETPPKVTAEGALRLPAWTNRHPDWRGEVLPGVSMQGRFEVGPGAYLGVPFSSAQSPFTLTNMIWRLPELKVARPEGTLEGVYESDQRTRDFHWQLLSTIDPKIARPLFQTEQQQRAFDFVQLSAPPVVEAEVWGRWGDVERIGAAGRLAATNFTFRGERVKDCVTGVHYTNRFLTFIDPEVRREGERGTAPGIGIDFTTRRVYFTNVTGNLNPYAVARAISAKTAAVIEPYRFSSAPNMRVDGVVDARRGGWEDALRFEVDGGPFQWKKFRLPRVKADIDWLGRVVTLTNAQAAFYGGQASGFLRLQFGPTNDADFAFRAEVTNAVLQWLMADLSTKTNKLEGTLNGQLAVTRANSANLQSWQGHGALRLEDGLIWDIPFFGIFAPILDAFMPGLGHSRAKEGTATFVISNSVIITKDLSIRATAMRMQYEAAIDFDRRLEGRMEAEVLRDVPAVGLVISKLLWPVTKLFEYRISGTLDKPKAEPIFVLPKLILLPFRPLKTLQELFPDQPPPEDRKP